MSDTTGKSVEQVVNEIFKTLCEQGEPCIQDKVCSFGNDKGQHCAVGFLLDEEVDDGIMQSKDSIMDLSRYYSLGVNRDFIIENERILLECQCLHDADDLHKLITTSSDLGDMMGFTPISVSNWVLMRIKQMTNTVGSNV